MDMVDTEVTVDMVDMVDLVVDTEASAVLEVDMEDMEMDLA